MRPPQQPRFQPTNSVPLLGQQSSQAEAMVRSGIQAIASQLFIRNAELALDTADLERIAHDCMRAAESFFVGTGMVTRKSPPDAPESPTIDP